MRGLQAGGRAELEGKTLLEGGGFGQERESPGAVASIEGQERGRQVQMRIQRERGRMHRGQFLLPGPCGQRQR